MERLIVMIATPQNRHLAERLSPKYGTAHNGFTWSRINNGNGSLTWHLTIPTKRDITFYPVTFLEREIQNHPEYCASVIRHGLKSLKKFAKVYYDWEGYE